MDFCLAFLGRRRGGGRRERKIEGKFPKVLGPKTYGFLPCIFGSRTGRRKEGAKNRRQISSGFRT